jgi:predicted O-methyltransferase YrrM
MMGNVIGKFARLGYLTLAHPSWAFFLAYNKALQISQIDEKHDTRLAEYNRHLIALGQALEYATHTPLAQVEPYLNEIDELFPDKSGISSIPSEWNGSLEYIKLLHSICCLTRPTIVVETGVARGMSSLYILKAMTRNNHGHLFSIDFPIFANSEKITGYLVPRELRSRWTLRLGPSQYVIPKLLKTIKNIDLFICDSSHTYKCQKMEYTYALASLRQGGILISDNIINDAFIEIAEAYKSRPYIISQLKGNPIGLLVKP